MTAIIKFSCCLKIKIDDDSCDKIVPESQQIEQLKDLLTEELDSESVDITNYEFELTRD